MGWLIEAGVHVLLFCFGIWLFFKVRRWARDVNNVNLRWRRRMGLVCFLAPFILWVAELFVSPPLPLPLQALEAISSFLATTVDNLSGLTKEGLGWWWSVCLTPIFIALVYTAAGVLIGWPLDRVFGRTAEEEE